LLSHFASPQLAGLPRVSLLELDFVDVRLSRSTVAQAKPLA
jgi:hypothetical protein